MTRTQNGHRPSRATLGSPLGSQGLPLGLEFVVIGSMVVVVGLMTYALHHIVWWGRL